MWKYPEKDKCGYRVHLDGQKKECSIRSYYPHNFVLEEMLLWFENQQQHELYDKVHKSHNYIRHEIATLSFAGEPIEEYLEAYQNCSDREKLLEILNVEIALVKFLNYLFHILPK